MPNILTNQDIRSLTEDTPFAEGDGLGAFWPEAQHVMEAVKRDGTDFECLEYRSRLVYLFRAFYLLGVLRGGEVCRWTVTQEEPKSEHEDEMPFQLDAACADLFVSELATADSNELQPLYKLLKL